jgi:hypothetical protein
MIRLASFAMLASLLAPVAALAQVAAAPGPGATPSAPADNTRAVSITQVGSLSSGRGPAENFHRLRPRRPPVPGECSFAHVRRTGHLRAGCPICLAHLPA